MNVTHLLGEFLLQEGREIHLAYEADALRIFTLGRGQPLLLGDLAHLRFEQVSDRAVAVYGSRFEAAETYNIKLEGARKVAYRTFVVAGIRDPLLIAKIEEVEELVKQSVRTQLHRIDPETYQMNFYNYGIDGIMGATEPDRTPGHEICVMFEALAETQELANTICASMRSTLLHYGYPGRIATAGNLAFPFSPSDIKVGATYVFSVYALLRSEDPLQLFRCTYEEVGEG